MNRQFQGDDLISSGAGSLKQASLGDSWLYFGNYPIEAVIVGLGEKLGNSLDSTATVKADKCVLGRTLPDLTL